jgi:ParB/RepB/Spo0J family partition protein
MTQTTETRSPKDLRPNKTNPRTDLDITELTASIKEHGIQSPLACLPDGELVYGHRRLAAAKKLKLPAVPVIVRADLVGDLEAIAMAQLVENLQRADLHPLDEAAAYAKIAAEHARSTVEIAALVGKSEATVRRRLLLAELVEGGRVALRDGRLSVAAAEAIGRLAPASQTEVLDDVLDRHRPPKKGEEVTPLTASEIRWQIERQLRQLKEAPFDPKDELLVELAGSCSLCPRRTGNQGDLWGDFKVGDSCTDAACWDKKVDAAWHVQVDKHTAKGGEILQESAAKKILHTDGRLHYGVEKTYAVRTQKVDANDPSSKAPTWCKLLGKSMPPPLLARAPSGKAVKLYRVADLKKAAKDAGVKVPAREKLSKPKASGPSLGSTRSRHDVLQIATGRIVTAIVEQHRSKLTAPAVVLRDMIGALLVPPPKDRTDDGHMSSARFDELRELEQKGGKADQFELVLGVCEVNLREASYVYGGKLHVLLVAAADEAGVDPGAIVKEVEAELKAKEAEEKAAAKAKKKPAAKAKKKPTTKKGAK